MTWQISIYNVQRTVTPKVGKQWLWFLCSGYCQVVHNICVNLEISFYKVQWAVTQKVGKQEVWFLFSEGCLMDLYTLKEET